MLADVRRGIPDHLTTFENATGTVPVDVEHWRPKSEVHEEDGKRTIGYFERRSTGTISCPLASIATAPAGTAITTPVN